MEQEEINQRRHKEIVRFLSQYPEYRHGENTAVFKIQEKEIPDFNTKHFNQQLIFTTAVLITDVLKLNTGMGDGFDLYTLLQAYFRDEGQREKINVVLGVK